MWTIVRSLTPSPPPFSHHHCHSAAACCNCCHPSPDLFPLSVAWVGSQVAGSVFAVVASTGEVGGLSQIESGA